MKLIGLVVILLSFSQASYAQVQKDDLSKEKVILIHGFARSNMAMWKLAERLEKAGYTVDRVGYSSMTQDIEEIKTEVFKQIDECCSSRSNKVHFIGHSMGGLLARAYLGERKLKNLGNVVIMGSPNKGTPVVDRFKNSWWFAMAGPAAKSLSANGSKFLKSLKPPYYNLGVIAGNVEISSHEHILEGKDDGLVPLESTKVKGMKDFIIIKTNHTSMRYNEDVAKQAIYFLKHTRFNKKPLSPKE